MDYTHTFFAGSQPFQHPFVGIPPLTPSHSNSAASDDYNTSPPEGFPEFSNEPFPGYDSYAAQFTAQQPVFPGPPTPPSQQLPLTAVQPPAQQQQPVQSQPTAVAAALRSSTAMALDPQQHAVELQASTKTEAGIEEATWQLHHQQTQLQQLDQSQRNGSISDDEELTPAQSRRKAQNRAAQRAFRERKERHVKDLEAKLASLEAAQQQTATENERLKQDLQKTSTENEILRATSSLQAAAVGALPDKDGALSGLVATGPMIYNPTDFYADLLAGHDDKGPSHRVATSESGERLLGAGATWDIIVNHDLFKRGLVDVSDISNRLKHQAKCDGQGPVFEEGAIFAAIQQSIGSGSDSLL